MEKEFNLQKFVISVVLIGVILVIGIYITSAIGQTVKSTGTVGSVTNESGFINSTGYSLSKSGLEGFSGVTITAAFNATDNTPIVLANVSVNSLGTVTNATSYYWNSALLSYSYVYTAPTNASVAAGNVTSALTTGTSWISILVVVGFAIIILSMLTSGLGKATEEAGTPYY